MAEIPLKWKFTTAGTEDVKAKLNEVNRLLNSQEVDVKELDKAKRDLNRTVNQVVRAQTQQKNLYLAMHPNLLRVTRAMSTLNSVFRAGMAVSQTLNLMFLRQNSATAEVARTSLAADIAQRDYNAAVRDFGVASDEAQQKLNELNIALAEQEEAVNAEKQANLQKYFDIFTSVGTLISTTFNALMNNPKIADAVFRAGSKLGTLFGLVMQGATRLVVEAVDWLFPTLTGKKAMAGTVKAGGLIGASFGMSIVSAASAAISGLALGTLLFDPIDKWLRESLPGYKGFAEARDIESQKNIGTIFGKDSKMAEGAQEALPGWFGPKGIAEGEGTVKQFLDLFQPLIDVFTTGLPEAFGDTEANFTETIGGTMLKSSETAGEALKLGWAGIWNSIIGIFNNAGSSMTEGTNGIFRSLVNHINSLISAYNRAAKKLKRSTISKVSFSNATWTDIPAIAAANGFNGMVNQPTLFLAGEAGPEAVSITPSAGGGGGSGTTIIVNVAGSILTEKQLYKKIDDNLKAELRKRNFRLL